MKTSIYLCVCVCSVVSDSLRPYGLWPAKFHSPWDSLGKNSERPFPPPGDLPDSGTEPMSPASPVLAGRFFTTEPLGSPVPIKVDVWGKKRQKIKPKHHYYLMP